jgi:hypothetical protein
MRLLAFASLFTLAGCQATADRCRDIYLQSFSNRVYEQADSADQAKLGPQPPPRPSDVRWHDEHCWQGEPR